MNFPLWFMFAALWIVLVQSDKLDSGPQTFTEKTPTAQKLQKRYATKDVVVYLTPSQIKAIQEGKGYVSAEPVDEAEISEGNEDEQQQQPEQPEQDDLNELNPLQINLEEERQAPSYIPVDEPNFEPIEEEEPQFSWTYKPEENKFISSPEDAFAYWRFYPETETQTEQTQLEPDKNKEEAEEGQSETSQTQQQRFRLVPYEPSTEKNLPSTSNTLDEDSIRERWLRLLELNRLVLRKQQSLTERTTTNTKTASEQSKAEPDTTLSKLRFSSKYNDQKQAIENEERRKTQTEKRKAANKTPAVIRKEVTSAKQQAPLIKRIKVPTPVLVPIPEPFEVKVPHPFPVPVEIFRPISNPAIRPRISENNKSSRLFRIEGEKPKVSSAKKPLTPSGKTSINERRVSVDGKKEVTVEVPSRQRGQPERITIIRHIWEN